MLRILLISIDKPSLSIFALALEENKDVQLSWAGSGESALDMVSNIKFDLVVSDEKLEDMSGLDFAGRLVTINPMINCAVVSSLSHDDFHEASEGLGILAQLPNNPTKKNAESLLQQLKKLKEVLST